MRCKALHVFLLAVLAFAVMVGCDASIAIEKPTPGKDLMDSPVPPGETPGGQAKKMKVCPDGDCGQVVPIWSRESGFTGLDGQGMGYCVSYTLPDGTPGRVNVALHRPTDNEGLRQSVANAIRVISNEGKGRCMERASKLPLHVQEKAAAACAAEAAGVDRRAGNIRFAWEPERPFMIVGTDPIVCSCATLVADPAVVGARAACGGPCGNCVYCG